MKCGNLTDGQLLKQFAADESNREAFDQIVQRYWPMVYRICLRHCGVAQDAEDAAQNVFMALADRASDLQARTCLAGWLHRTASYTAQRWRRDLETRRRHERQAGELRPDIDSGGAGLEAREPLDELHRALGALPEDYRNALILHHFEGYTIEQVAELLATRPGTVAARLSRGRAMLRERLEVLGAVIVMEDLDERWLGEMLPDQKQTVMSAQTVPVGGWSAPAGGATIGGNAAASVGGSGMLSIFLKFKVALIIVGLPICSLAAGGVAHEILAPPSPPTVAVAVAGGGHTSTSTVSKTHDPTDDGETPSAPSWGRSSVPEPSGLVPLALAGGFLMRRRRFHGAAQVR